ncbi:hypothetical protein TSUD_194370 [Trifolium subterraneum]|uniref:SANTA domain-containing protein n=1 Tax=Trifolium subterraneum TaxID=3900 RepID=A0A2Z6NM46_TRISU|nr:hypothetical protein TSUD_194370 [Trifolium subterraneum]
MVAHEASKPVQGLSSCWDCFNGVICNVLNLKLQVIASNTLIPHTINEVCRRFAVGFPHNWKNYSAHSSGNECQYVDKVASFDDSNASSHKKTADEASKEVMEAEVNGNIVSIRLPQPQVGIVDNGENVVSDVNDLHASPHLKKADVTSHEAMEATASLRLSQPLVDVVYNGDNRVSDVDDLNASFHQKTADVTSQEAMEAEDNNNIGSLRLSQPQVDLINNGENEVSIAAAAESRQSLMSVFEFDPIHEQSNVRSPLYPKKLEFEHLSSDRKEKKHIKKKIVEDTSSLCRRVLTRSIAKKSQMMLKRDEKAEVKCYSCPVRRSPRIYIGVVGIGFGVLWNFQIGASGSIFCKF